LIRAEPWDFPYNGEKVRAIRFYKTTSKEDDTTMQVWLSEKEHIPLRYIIGLKDEYGVTLQVDLKKIPNIN
jgi:methylase of polypeptide subunit release factors